MVKYWQFDDEYPIVDMYFFKIRVMYVKFQFENLRFMVYGLKNPLYVHCIWIGYDWVRPTDRLSILADVSVDISVYPIWKKPYHQYWFQYRQIIFGNYYIDTISQEK